MNYFTYYQRSAYLLELIEKGRLLSPDQLTEKFECSERTIRRMIENLRLQGHDIKYCKRDKRYYTN